MKTQLNKFLQSLLAIILFFSTALQSFGQLSGYYTIGGTGADYPTLATGLTDLYAQGMNGDVTFALNPGTHLGPTLTEIPGASDSSRFTIQSATLDSTSVNFNQTIKFQLTSHITLRSISVSAVNINAIDVLKSFDIVVENCRINATLNKFYDGAICVDHTYSGVSGMSNITINRCVINNTKACVYTSGYNGVTNINYCELNSSEYFAVDCDYTRWLNIYNNVINGGIVGDQYLSLKNNLIIGEVDAHYADSVLNNHFMGEESVEISSKYFKGNIFDVPYIHCSNELSKYIDNYFGGMLDLDRSTNIQMYENTFVGDIYMSFNKALHFERNIAYGDLKYGTLTASYWDFLIADNIFIGGRVRATGHHSIIRYNNFVDGAYLYVDFPDIKVWDNNFCQGVQGSFAVENVEHNNYYPLIYCFYDTLSTHYDPMYLSDNPGIATNPLLQGKGRAEASERDVLGNLRKNPPAMGANEVFVCSDSLNNNISVPCGEELYLNLCNLPDTGTYNWLPDSCVVYLDSAYTRLTAHNNMQLYLNNSVYGIIDSIKIITEPFQVEIAEMPLFYCGYPMTLNATYHPNAQYHWTPEEGLTDPNIRNPLLLMQDTNNLEYILECQIDGCGSSFDTIHIDFDPLPVILLFYPEQIADTVYFRSISTCVDEYLWDFGDGFYSTEQNPSHAFPENGTYTITITGTNQYGSTVRSFEYDFYFVSTPFNQQPVALNIYPNPVDDNIIIEGLPDNTESSIQILDLSGSVLSSTMVNAKKINLDTQSLKNGVYIVVIRSLSELYTSKFSVIH